MYHDNIVALATAQGEAGIGIIRLSGGTVISEVNKIFLPYRPETNLQDKEGYSLTLGWVLDDCGDKIDQVLMGLMKAPHSYTGEEVVEINCHGGSVPVRRCMERCLEIGIRMAEPGEFTKRAFLNGRMDLSQAEAVIDVIRSKTDHGLRLAMQQLDGLNSRYLEELEEDLLKVNAMVEASIDFPEDVGDLDLKDTEVLLKKIISLMDQYLRAGERSQIYRDGAKVAICGKPNVGKSSLLNLLARKERAIVTEIPGTTRDVIEEYINIRGIPIRIMDTAGIHFTEDVVEKIGIKKTKEVIENADLVIMLLDVASGFTSEDRDIVDNIDRNRLIIVVNKEDLEEKKISAGQIQEMFNGIRVIRASVKQEFGIEELEGALEEMLLKDDRGLEGLELMMNLRQKNALNQSLFYVKSALEGLQESTLDCLGVDVRVALEYLGEITGKTFKDEVIDRIFHDFCIGK